MVGKAGDGPDFQPAPDAVRPRDAADLDVTKRRWVVRLGGEASSKEKERECLRDAVR